MAANVRCAGNGSPRRAVVAPAPCGWKGERLAAITMCGVTTKRDILTRPCPHCDGRVELIPRGKP